MSTDIWFVAVVRAAEHVRFTAAGPTRAAVAEQLADYVWEQTPRKLAPHEHAKVSALLSSGALGMAVDLYFAALGRAGPAHRYHGRTRVLHGGIDRGRELGARPAEQRSLTVDPPPASPAGFRGI